MKYGVRENQLELALPRETQNRINFVLPEGFYLRNYQKSDEKGFLELLRLSGLAVWNSDDLTTVVSSFLPEGLFVVVEKESEKIVASMGARHTANNLHPNAGDIGWLCAHPDYSGKGLGYIARCSFYKSSN